ncbi:MAG TPA: immunoglobulin domain-containing protein, partial [Verrucomicrobiae bacterium]|nr:immunoglobulin domain-containing protein [Verrucomicrobiae bacterium]
MKQFLKVLLPALLFAFAPVLSATPPTITTIPDTFINEDTALSLVPFTVSDAETPAANLTVSASSSNAGLIPNDHIVLTGSGASRFLSLMPATNQVGISFISVHVADSEGLSADTSFLVKVLNVNDPPSISLPTNTVTGDVNGFTRLDFVVNDPDGTDNLALVGQSLNQSLVPDTGIFFNGTGTNRTIIINPVFGQTGAARINITVADTDGQSAAAFFDLVVSAASAQPPAITAQPASVSAALGATVTFTVVATGDEPLRYQWLRNGLLVNLATNSSLVLSNITQAQEGSYTVSISNPAGSTNSQPATLTIVSPPVILTQPASQTVIVGSNVDFFVDVGGQPPFGYVWYFNATNVVTNSTGPFLEMDFVQFTNSGNYTVVVNNGSGAVTSQVAVLTVNPRPNVPPIVSISSPAAGTKFIAPRNLRVSASASDLDGSVTKVDFYDGATLLGTATTAPFAITYTNAAAGAHAIAAVVTDNAGATGASATVTVTGVSDFGTQPGHLDGNFLALGTDGAVESLALQSDGKILAGGSFTTMNDLPRGGLARLNTDGSVDTTYNPALAFDSTVNAVAIGPDGKAIAAGSFSMAGAAARVRVVRLNQDGSVDTAFNPGAGPNNVVYAAAVQSDGKVLIGGSFSAVNNFNHASLARLNPDGSVDPAFDAGLSGGVFTRVNAIVIQADGKILVGGDFTTAGGATASHIVRLTGTGAVDSTFVTGSGANDSVNAIAVQADGKIILAGAFTQFNSTALAGV